MYFNIWSSENYILKWFFLLLLLVLIIFIIIKICIKAYRKYKITYQKKQDKVYIKDIIRSDDDEKVKFDKIKNILWLKSSYDIQKLIWVKNKEILDLIHEKKYSTINNMIYNKIINNE